MNLQTRIFWCVIASAQPCITQSMYNAILDRRYDEVTFACAHNAQSYKESEFKDVSTLSTSLAQTLISVRNQSEDISKQLEGGIRACKVPVFLQDGKLVACHGINKYVIRDVKNAVDSWIETAKKDIKKTLHIALPAIVEKAAKAAIKKLLPEKIANIYFNPDKVKAGDLDPSTIELSRFLAKIHTFIENNPHEIVTIFLEVWHKDPAMIKNTFTASGLTPYLYVQPIDTPWPTLHTMISQNKRVVVFIDITVDTNSYPFNTYSQFAWSSPYNFSSVEKLNQDATTNTKCPTPQWKNIKNGIWILQHFVTMGTGGNREQAEHANKKETILNRVNRYKQACDLKNPQFIWVDFYNTPKNNGVIDAIKALNGI
ncbi:hypothetical protein CVU75_01475 [Candidatus Dependentiae bacterium HGW-Dependentiae-1]|nr:MAG: hypothetical protein CVU75_01475 [Candidatus Dependentiae bacterium HGW-Dependentiae-1]